MIARTPVLAIAMVSAETEADMPAPADAAVTAVLVRCSVLLVIDPVMPPVVLTAVGAVPLRKSSFPEREPLTPSDDDTSVGAALFSVMAVPLVIAVSCRQNKPPTVTASMVKSRLI